MRRFLVWLADAATGREEKPCPAIAESHHASLATWLASNDLGPLAYHLLRRRGFPVAGCLREVAMAAAARNLSHFELLDRIQRAMRAARLPIVLFKGAALAEVTYGEVALRPMIDVDIWVRDHNMARAVALLKENGFCRAPSNPQRPPALQRHAGGEIQFRPRDGSHGLIELHWSPFPGWWNRLTANVDEQAVWDRAEPFGDGRHALRLSPEDAVLQLVFHVGVNHFGEPTLRGLMDIALTARTRHVDWLVVAARAREWSLATMTWTVLDLVSRLFDAPGIDVALETLQPWRPRRSLIERFVSSGSVVEGANRPEQRARLLMLIALIDHYPDMARLVWRTLWPQPEWLAARYRHPVGHFRHLWLLLRYGDV
jgi:hypothetical protein